MQRTCTQLFGSECENDEPAEANIVNNACRQPHPPHVIMLQGLTQHVNRSLGFVGTVVAGPSHIFLRMHQDAVVRSDKRERERV